MPIYVYRCESCGHVQDVLQKISDPVLTVCPACGEPDLRKQVTAAGFQLKGSGWYATDFRGANKPAAKDGDGAADDAKKADKGGGAANGDAGSGDKAGSDTTRSDTANGDAGSADRSKGDTGNGHPSKGESAKGDTAKGDGPKAGSSPAAGAAKNAAAPAASKAPRAPAAPPAARSGGKDA